MKRFIALDGVEGCGKSSQALMLARALEGRGVAVVLTREPGGTAVGSRIRELLLDSSVGDITTLTEMFLFCADRAQHVAEVIRPALDAGSVVVTDRFSSSTAAYQGHAGGLGVELFDRVNMVATGGLVPDLTIILDADPAVGFARKFRLGNDEADRIESKSAQYHLMVREGFIEYARRLGDRALVLDADQPPEALHEQIMRALGMR